MELTLNDITDHLGQPRTKIGGEMIWQCPICMDKSADNLHYNPNKNILWCFANEEHSKIILSEIMKKKYEEKKMSNVEIPKYVKCQEQYLMYQILCNDALLGILQKGMLDHLNDLGMLEESEYDFYLDLINSDKPQKAREYLKEQRGINTSTISATGLGFDFYARKWVIPIFDMTSTLVGFEYRLADFKNKKIWREQGSPSCLARIWGNGNKALIFEGFLDSYCALQMAKNKDDVSIFSTSSGVSSLTKVISQLQFNKYESITLILDNDEPADKVVKEIIEQYPFIKDGRQFLKDSGCKDVNEYMLKKEVE
jgi:DNA primase